MIDWLNGRNTAHTAGGELVKASWTTGAVGMIGKSYDGTLANGVAATGVKGLKTIVPISAISSWYDYTRSGGVPYSDDYMPWLGGYVGHDSAGLRRGPRASSASNDDDETGDYTSFWAERDYMKDASKVKASVFMTHGLSDYNVQTNHFAQWWSALSREQRAAQDVARSRGPRGPVRVPPRRVGGRTAQVVRLLAAGPAERRDEGADGHRSRPRPDVWRDYKTWPAVNRPCRCRCPPAN